jgi:hypothetical protein
MSTTLTAVTVLANLATVALEITLKMQQVSQAIAKAQSEGRDLSDVELAAIKTLDDDARKRLDEAIAKA